MDDSFDEIGVMTRVPALAESEDMESIDADRDDADADVEIPPSIVVDRYGFSGGQQYTNPDKEYLPSVEVLRSREMKWLDMCRNWDYWSTSGYKKLRERCRKGIPDSMRGEAWQRLVGSATSKSKRSKAFVEEPVEPPPSGVSPFRRLFGSSSRLSGSRSLPTVVTNSPSAGRSRILESSLFYIPEFLYQSIDSNGTGSAGDYTYSQESQSKPPMRPQNLPPLLPHPAAREIPSNLALYQNSFSRRKGSHSSSHFMSFRKFSSLFRLNSTSSNINTAQNLSAATGDAEDTDAANFYERSGNPVSEDTFTGLLAPPDRGSGGDSDRSRTYSAALPSAAYLGIPTNSIRGISRGVGGTVSGRPQPCDSATTTTSTGVSTDAYSTSSNFFSTAESSAESLRVSAGAPDCSLLNSPPLAVHSHRRLFATETGAGEASPISSQFSTLSSTHRSSDDIDIDIDGDSSSPPLSLSQGMHDNQHKLTTAAAKDREATLVAPNSNANVQILDPYMQYEIYSAQEGDPAICEQIGKDIHRQFPFHELFCSKNSGGRESLFAILKAYTVRHPSKGYCQGQAPLAAVLLMFMPEAEAFWTFTKVCERNLFSYYDEGLELIQIDGQVLYGLLKRLFPHIYKFLMKHGAEPIMLVVEWFMCVYTRTLPWASALRVLDMFFCEGKIIIFRVGLLLLYRCFNSSTFRKSCGGIDEILLQAQTVPSQLDNPEELVHEILKIRLDQRQVAREVIKQSQRWRVRMSAVHEKEGEK